MARGRPPTYKTAEEMQKVIDAYFNECDGKLLTDDDGEPILDKYGNEIWLGRKPYTITGLAYALGFTSRLALINYEGKAEFVNTVKRAKMRCEQYAEERLFDRDGQRGAEFNLRVNHKWAVPKDDEGEKGSEGGVIFLPEVGK